MDVEIKFDREEEKRLLQQWFETVQFDTESEGIPPIHHDPDEDDDETKTLDIRIGDFRPEVKVIRRVRTMAGVRRYKQPIGSIILRDNALDGLELGQSQWAGWERVRDKWTGQEYDIGQDEDGKWIATRVDADSVNWDAVVEADSEEDAYAMLNDLVTPENQRRLRSQSNERSDRPSNNAQEAIADDFGSWVNELNDYYSEPEAAELAEILDSYPRDANEYETRAAIRRWLDRNPDQEFSHLAHSAINTLNSNTKMPKRNSIEQDEARGREIAAQDQATAAIPRPVKLNEVQPGMWIQIPERGDEWLEVVHVSNHSSARKSFVGRDRNGKRIDFNQVTNREKIVATNVKPGTDAGNPNSPETREIERQINNPDPVGQAARPSGVSNEEFFARVEALGENPSRQIRDAIAAARAKRRAGFSGETDLAEAEVLAGLRPREDLARSRAGEYLGPPSAPTPAPSTSDSNFRSHRAYPNLQEEESDFDGYELYTDRQGNRHYIAKDGARGWGAWDEDDNDIVVGKKTRAQLMSALNERAAPPAEPAPAPRAARQGRPTRNRDTSQRETPSQRAAGAMQEMRDAVSAVQGDDIAVAEEALGKLNATQLRQVAGKLGISVGNRDSADKLRATILQFGMRTRLNSRAISRPNLEGGSSPAYRNTNEPTIDLGGKTYTAQELLDYAQADPVGFLEDWINYKYPGTNAGGQYSRRERIHRTRWESVVRRIEREGWTNEQAARELREWGRLQVAMEGRLYFTAADILDGTARPRNTRAHRREDLETKAIRRVRTAEGERRYGQPIGSIIVRDGANPLSNLRVGANNREVRSTSGDRYRTRQNNGKWEAVDDSGNVVVSSDSEEKLLEDLDSHVGSSGGSGGNSPDPGTPDPDPAVAPEASRSDSDDDGDKRAWKGPDGTVYYATETDDGKWEIRDANNVVIAEGQDSEDDAVKELNRFLETSARPATGTDPAPEAPDVGPVMPDSEQARAEIARQMQNATPQQMQNVVRQAGGNPDGLTGRDLLAAAMQAMFFLLLGVPLPASFFGGGRKSLPLAMTGATKNADGTPHTGAMIALIPNAGEAQRLATEPGEPWDELHVTLAFLGEADDISESAKISLARVASVVANNMTVVEGRGFAVNIFNPTGEEPCVVLGVGDQPGGGKISSLYQAVQDMVRQTEDEQPGFTYPEQHTPFVPHITLRYFKDEPIDMGYVEDVMMEKTGPVRFDRIRVAFGGKYIDMPLIGKDTMGDVPTDQPSEYKASIITPGGRPGNDRRLGSRRNGENWVEQTAGELPRYIRIVRNGLMREGHSESRATALAVAAVKRWARGGGNVSPKVQAAAAKAVAEWMAMRAAARGKKDAAADHLANRITEGSAAAAAAARRIGRGGGSGNGSGGGRKRRVASAAGSNRYGKPVGAEIGRADVDRKRKADALPDSVKKRLPMEYGQQGPHIAKIQKILTEAGFELEGDGIFGKKTQAAIQEAQKQLGLKVTGVIDPITFIALQEAAASTRNRND